MLAELHDIDVLNTDIGNEYLNASCREKIYCVVGPEFGPEKAKMPLILKAMAYHGET